jgi:hypothetical protein
MNRQQLLILGGGFPSRVCGEGREEAFIDS